MRHAVTHEKHMPEQSLRRGMALLGRDRQPTNGGDVVLGEAPSADHVHVGEIILRVRVAEDRGCVLKQFVRSPGVGPHVAIRYAVQAIDADRDERVGDRAEISPVRLVFVVIFDQLVEVMVRLQVILRNALAVRIHLAEFPAREILPAIGGVGERCDRRIGVASLQIGEAGAQRLIRIGEVFRDLLRRVGC